MSLILKSIQLSFKHGRHSVVNKIVHTPGQCRHIYYGADFVKSVPFIHSVSHFSGIHLCSNFIIINGIDDARLHGESCVRHIECHQPGSNQPRFPFALIDSKCCYSSSNRQQRCPGHQVLRSIEALSPLAMKRLNIIKLHSCRMLCKVDVDCTASYNTRGYCWGEFYQLQCIFSVHDSRKVGLLFHRFVPTHTRP